MAFSSQIKKERKRKDTERMGRALEERYTVIMDGKKPTCNAPGTRCLDRNNNQYPTCQQEEAGKRQLAIRK